MDKFSWDEALHRTGHELIDNQHKVFIDLFNKLVDLAQQKSPSKGDYLRSMIRLLEYTENHFTTEMMIFSQYNYQMLDEHQRDHEQFNEVVSSHIVDGGMGQLNQLIETLHDWLLNHFAEECEELRRLQLAGS